MNYLKERKEHVGKGRLRSPYGASHILQLKETRPTKCLKAMNDLATKFGSHTLLKEDPRNCEIRMFTVGVGYESKVKHYCSLCTLNNTSFNNSEALVFYGIDLFVPGECCKCSTSALHAWHSLQDYLLEDWSWDLVQMPRAATAVTHRHPPGSVDISAVGDHLKSLCQPSWVRWANGALIHQHLRQLKYI